MNMSKPFQYSQLTEPDQIRLVSLQPDPDLEAPVRCSLITGSLDFYEHDLVEHYIALSYVWGDASMRRIVQVGDGSFMNITVSLESALRHLRDKTRTFLVWADGLCINQDDIEERNRQVPMMGRIYGTARTTIIFLQFKSDGAGAYLKELSQGELDQ